VLVYNGSLHCGHAPAGSYSRSSSSPGVSSASKLASPWTRIVFTYIKEQHCSLDQHSPDRTEMLLTVASPSFSLLEDVCTFTFHLELYGIWPLLQLIKVCSIAISKSHSPSASGMYDRYNPTPAHTTRLEKPLPFLYKRESLLPDFCPPLIRISLEARSFYN
jgi:hypothetical protein